MYNICMEYVAGGTLHDAIRRHGGQLDEPTIRLYTRDILQGLEYLHTNGLVHCDIKSKNVLISKEGAKIADFGCAKYVEKVGGCAMSEFSGTPRSWRQSSDSARLWRRKLNGLGLIVIPGVVGHFDSSNGFRVPHIGWNALQIAKDSEILDDIGNRHVYFLHSYRAMPAVVVSIDPRRVYLKNPSDLEFKAVRVTNPGPNGEEYAWYQCTVSGGREGRSIGACELAKAVEELEAGETLLNCIDCDGENFLSRKGFDIDLIKLISDAVKCPFIQSAKEHFLKEGIDVRI
ncbi:hypothetical protein GH714_007446 [Hevea brasiliensis]|uniref:Protein kinase domain-containing protein n=1 Tax=Hevea brasiliensis TaxID=3981 RepID=A0A6A6KC75_HEVBR|nr:hypothetical protein GH714_007446 [Hevea brasiliensis]